MKHGRTLPTLFTLAVTTAAAFATTVCAAAQPVPAADARETVWSAYVASKFEDSGDKCVCEYKLSEDSRIDIYQHHGMGGYTAWEVERAAKFKEAIGQALFYQLMTNASEGGIVLMALGDPSDKLDILRCKLVCQKVGLRLLVVDKSGALR